VDIIVLIGRVLFSLLLFATAGAEQNEMTQVFKNLALAGASLLLFAFFADVGDDLGIP
jgi:hypothetical protein